MTVKGVVRCVLVELEVPQQQDAIRITGVALLLIVG